MRLLLLLLLTPLAASAQSFTYERGYGLPGNGFDYSGLTDGEGFILATHEAFGIQVPLSRERTYDAAKELGVRAAYVRLQYHDPEPGSDSTASFPGVYAYFDADLYRGGGPMGIALTGQVGYDVYQSESAVGLIWVPHVAGGLGPAFRLGPTDVRVLGMGQLSSFLQGVALFLRVDVGF